MSRNLALPTCILSLWLASIPALSASPDRNLGVTVGNQWSRTLQSSIFVRPPPPLPPLRYLAQAQTQPNAAPGGASAPAIPEDAVKAEMEKRWGDAERIYRGLLAKEPDRIDLLLRLVDVLAAEGKKLEAAKTLARAADLKPDDAELQLHVSEGFAAADRPADALRYVDRVLKLRPNDLDVQRRRARLAVWAGDYPQAVESLRTLTAANPADLKLNSDLAQVLGWQGKWNEAAKVLSGYLAEHPDDKEALLDLARVQASAGDPDAAQQSLEHYRAAGGDDATYRRELAKVQSDLSAPIKAENEHRLGDAERMYREMLSREPGRADLLLRLVDVLAAEKKPAEAAQTLAQAADLKPDDGDLQLRASQAFGAADQPAEALRYIDRALATRPNDQALLRQRAQLATWAGNYAEAEKTLRRLIAANPADLTLKRDLGRVLGWQGHTDEAVKLLSAYVAQHPEDKDAVTDLEHLKAARGKPHAAQRLLKRHRNGGGRAAYLRERARRLAPRRARLPSSAPPAASPTATGPGATIPPAILKAEGEKRWGDAERLYRQLLAKQPSRVDLLLRLADVLAVEKKRLAAAQTLARTADLRPKDGDLQRRASQAFGAANRPADALRYVDRALTLHPTDQRLHRRRATLAAWAGDNAQAVDSLRILVAANPADLALKRDLGRVRGWQGHLDEAVDLLSIYVAAHPEDKDAVLDLARNQAGRGNSDAAVDLLRRYRAAGGDDLTYRRELSLVLAWAARNRSALALTEPGLAADPADFQFHFARAVALRGGYEYAAASSEVDRLAQLRPNAPEIGDLRRSIEVPQRPYMQFDAGARWESDTIDAQANTISYHQPINDAWWVFAGGGADYLTARSGGAFAPIQGGSFMARGFGFVGAQARLDYGTIAAARAGTTDNGRVSAAAWQVSVDSQLSDELRVQLVNMRDFQIVSPRSLSLGITRIDTALQLTYTPDLLWTVATIAQEGELSDGNQFRWGYLAPRRAVLRTEKWNVDLGISGNWQGYTLQPPQNGYYSPFFYQQYATNAYIYYKMSPEDGVSLLASLGAQRDETFHSFKFTNDFSVEATFGQLSDWMLKLRAGYTNHSNTGPAFSAESVGMTLVRRF